MDHPDVIVVGARVAGAATALLLARAGHRVVVLDLDHRGADTLSTHALMRPAVTQLERWGLLDALVATGTPPIHEVVFHYGDRQVALVPSRPLYAPRRTVLDPLLVSAAEAAGAQFRFGVDVRDVVTADGRVVGVRVREGRHAGSDLHARLVVGADGRRSRIARAVGAPTTRVGTASSGFAFGYWRGVDLTGYHWGYRPGSAAGVIPTTGGVACVFVGVQSSRFDRQLCDPRHLLDLLDTTSPYVAARVAAARLEGPVRAFPGLLGWVRRPWGPGWALVGDAGYFKDPTTAHGISDALRDAELLAGAAHEHLAYGVPAEDAMATYEHIRDGLSLEFFEATERMASFDWSLAEAQRLHLRMSDLMQREVDAMEASGVPV